GLSASAGAGDHPGTANTVPDPEDHRDRAGTPGPADWRADHHGANRTTRTHHHFANPGTGSTGAEHARAHRAAEHRTSQRARTAVGNRAASAGNRTAVGNRRAAGRRPPGGRREAAAGRPPQALDRPSAGRLKQELAATTCWCDSYRRGLPLWR